MAINVLDPARREDATNHHRLSDAGFRYFAYFGSLLAVVIAVTYINRLRLGERGWMFTWQLLAIATVTALFAIAVPYGRRIAKTAIVAGFLEWLPLDINRLAILGAALAAAALVVLDHRRYVIILAVLQLAVLHVLRPRQKRLTLWLFGLLSAVTWAFASGLTYTHLADWLLSSTASSLAIPAFIFSFALVLVELNDGAASVARRSVLPVLAVSLVLFSLYALRTDGMLANWVPYHRSFFADAAQSVKDGHWLLWDVPSLYGFLSILTLSVFPGNGWQALYELTAVFLVIQALACTFILRYGRTGWRNAAFAVLVPIATIFADNIARDPWSARLYPQGGLRFFWVTMLLLVAFLIYVFREREKLCVALRYAGHAIWLIAVFWSVDNLLWASVLWLPYVAVDALTNPMVKPAFGSIIYRVISRAWPLVALPCVAVAYISAFYHSHLGASPDWRSYVEFTGLFTSGKVREVFYVQDLGAGWTIIIVLGAVGSVLLAALKYKRWDLVRLLTAAWFAVWGTATYFALEPLDMYVSLLTAVLVPAMGIMLFASREGLQQSGTAVLARLSVAPTMIIAIAVSLGSPSHFAEMKTPLSPSWRFDVTQEFPPINGELAGLITMAGIRPSDKIAVTNGPYWTELTQGLILPFTSLPDGKIVEYHSWLPSSPVGPEESIEQLPPARQAIYVHRYLNRTHQGGWYITYRTSSDCNKISSDLVTVKTYRTTNFSASLCRYASNAH